MPTQPNDSPRATHSSQPSVQSATITPSGPLLMDRVHQGDCLELLARVPAGTVQPYTVELVTRDGAAKAYSRHGR